MFGGPLIHIIIHRTVNRGDDVRRWVKEIKQCNELIRVNSLRPYEFIVVTPLEKHLQELSKCFHEAQLADHIVQYTLLVSGFCSRSAMICDDKRIFRD